MLPPNPRVRESRQHAGFCQPPISTSHRKTPSRRRKPRFSPQPRPDLCKHEATKKNRYYPKHRAIGGEGYTRQGHHQRHQTRQERRSPRRTQADIHRMGKERERSCEARTQGAVGSHGGRGDRSVSRDEICEDGGEDEECPHSKREGRDDGGYPVYIAV